VNDLVKRLSEGLHPVEVSLRPEKTVKLFKEMLDRGHVLVKFTQTRGGTELGVPLDKSRSDLTQANFETETGKVRVSGELTLDYVPVRVVADIDLPSLEGQGRLEILGEQRVA
jgi:Core binding factor beta subunit